MAAGSSGSSGNQQKFAAGWRVSCTTRSGEKIEGEVLAFDQQYKILVLKLPSSSAERGTCNINFLNTELLQEYEVSEKGAISPLYPLDMTKIHQRTEQNLERRQKQSERIGVGVSPLAQKLFDLVSKTFDLCRWNEKTIVIKSVEVNIVPPYKPENIHGDPKASEHIKKLVEKFHEEQKTTL